MALSPLISREVAARIRTQQVDLSRTLTRVVQLCETAPDPKLSEYLLSLQGALRCHADRVDQILRGAAEGE